MLILYSDATYETYRDLPTSIYTFRLVRLLHLYYLRLWTVNPSAPLANRSDRSEILCNHGLKLLRPN